MKKTLFVLSLMAVAALTLGQSAYASALKITTTRQSDPFAVKSDSVTDIVENVVVKNTSTGSSGTNVTLDSIEVWFGGTGYNIAGNTPPSGSSYDLDATSAGNLSHSGDVTVNSGNPGDQITYAELVNNSGSGECYVGEVLTKGSTCEVELILGVTGVAPVGSHGDASKSSSSTAIFMTVNGSGSTENSAEFGLEIDYAPEPGSLVLLGTGFGLMGLALFLRKRYAQAASHMRQTTIV